MCNRVVVINVVFLAGPKGQLFKSQCPSVLPFLCPSFPEADICYIIFAIAITRERVIVHKEVIKQGPTKIQF
jgi:hypothetical protein